MEGEITVLPVGRITKTCALHLHGRTHKLPSYESSPKSPIVNSLPNSKAILLSSRVPHRSQSNSAFTVS